MVVDTSVSIFRVGYSIFNIHPHAARAEFVLDGVAVGEGSLEADVYPGAVAFDAIPGIGIGCTARAVCADQAGGQNQRSERDAG